MHRLVLITGMHRSGTSLLTQLIQSAGVCLGDPSAQLRAGSDNPRGYGELGLVKECNDELLSVLGGSWDQPPPLLPGWEADPLLDPFRRRAKEALESAGVFGSGAAKRQPTGVKDPRFAVLHPFWTSIAPFTHQVMVVRHPAEVAASLLRRNQMTVTQSAVLWIRHLLAAEEFSGDQLCIHHDDLYVDPAGVVDTVRSFLGCEDASSLGSIPTPDASLRHHHNRDADEQVGGPDPVAALALAMWEQLDEPAHGLDPQVRQAFAQGLLRPPPDTRLLDRARAELVAMQEAHRQRKRRELARQQSRSTIS